MTKNPQSLYIIDAMALAFRSFFAFNRTMLSTSQGIPTGAIFGSAMFVNKLVTERHPDYLVAVADAGGPTFRHAMYKDYKATRQPMPGELAAQLPHILEMFSRFKCPLLQIQGVEADDVIATLARGNAGEGLHAYIVSGDKDFYQLVNSHVSVYAPKKNEEALVIDAAGVQERFHCRPEQMADVLALIGDTVDNVPGVDGIGEKGAAQLIERFGSLEGIYGNLDAITAKRMRENLIAQKAAAFLSRDLVRLKSDMDLPVSLNDMRSDWRTAAANRDLLEFYERFEFKSLAAKVRSQLQHPRESAASEAPASPPVPPAAAAAQAVRTAQTPQSVDRQALATQAFVGLAVTANGEDIVDSKAVSVTFALADGSVEEVPLTEEGVWRLRPVLEAGHRPTLVGHNLKFAIHMLRRVGLELAAPWVDTEICDYLLDPNNYNHALDGICARYAASHHPAPDNPGSSARAALAAWEAMRPRLEEQGLLKVLHEVEMPLVPVLAEMELDGLHLDSAFLENFSNELAETAKNLERQIYAAAGREFNINSPKQLQQLLFDELHLHERAGIKRMKKTKTGFSTDESVLQRLAAAHPVPRLILEYRGVAKLKNTYVDPLPQYMHPRTGRVHTSLNQTVAATGRLSSDRPNLQNIPMRTALGRRIRAAFRPENPDHRLIAADYSQVELRLLAHMADATDMIEAFKRGLDVHTVTAARIFGVPATEVDPVMRSRAKSVNFGIIYGMGPMRLAEETGVTLTEAKSFIARYFAAYPGIRTYTRSLIETAREKGYCTTMMGRRRPVPEIREANAAIRVRGENIAVNAPIQGSAADLIKLAMIRVHAGLRARRFRTRLLLQVHDELVFEGPESEVQAVIPVIKEAMEGALATKVPLKVDIHVGVNWLEAK